MLVGGVDEHRVARCLVAQDEHVVLVRPDDDLVDPHVGGLVVRRASQRRGMTRGYCGAGAETAGQRVASARRVAELRRRRTVGRGRSPIGSVASAWLGEHLGRVRGAGAGGGPSDETGWDVRVEWEKLLGADRWVGLSWPTEYGGRHCDLAEQMIFNEEYTRDRADALSFFGEGLFAPTLIQFGTDEQTPRPPEDPVVEELWCQGFSEPNAGSDLANIQTRACSTATSG